MGDNFFIDGMYNQKQINAINNAKAKAAKLTEQPQGVNGDSQSIFNDINAYKSDATQKTNNSDLFNYIEQTMGMNNFLEMLDANEDGVISEDEAKKLSSLDTDAALTSADIDKLVSDIKDLKNAKKTTVSGDTKTETVFEADSTGKLIKKTSTTMNKDTNVANAVYTYDEKGNVITKEDKLKNNKITYEYTTDSAGKTTKKSTTLNIPTNTVIAEHQYDENNNVVTKVDKVNNRTTTYEYTTDSAGKTVKDKATVTNTKTGEVTALETYKDNKRITREDKIANTTTTYAYDAAGNLASNKVTANDGKNTLKSESTYYTSGEYKGKTKDKTEYYSPTTGLKCNSYWTYDKYDSAGRILERTHYAGGSAKGEATKFEYSYPTDKYTTKPSSRKNTKTGEIKTYTYNEDNELTQVTFKDKTGKELYSCKCNKDGTYASKTKGNKVTIYEYSKGGFRSKAVVYNASDIGADGKPKAGAKPISTVEYDTGVKTKKTTAEGEITEYDKDGNITKTTNKNGDVTEYDKDGKKTKTTTKKGDVTEYDKNGKKTKTTFANGNITYYKNGKTIEVDNDHVYVYKDNGDGTKTRTEYTKHAVDDNGNIKSTADVISTAKIDSKGNVIEEKEEKEDEEKDD